LIVACACACKDVHARGAVSGDRKILHANLAPGRFKMSGGNLGDGLFNDLKPGGMVHMAKWVDICPTNGNVNGYT
jgi:hypothetical protein